MEELDKETYLTEEEFMNEMYKEVAEVEVERVRKNIRIINTVKLFKGKKWSEELIRYFNYDGDELLELEDCDEDFYCPEENFEFHFTTKPAGRQHSDNMFPLLKPYVNQTLNGGMTGDDFGGTVSIFLKEGKYLTWYYSI